MIICISLFIALMIGVVKNNYIFFDQPIYNFITNYINNTNIMKFITKFGNTSFILIGIIIIIILIKNKKDKVLIPSIVILNVLINQILKIIIRRPRPNVNVLIKQGGYSFPSGHSMISMAFYGILIYLIYKKIDNKKLKYFLISILVLLILLIGISRIYLGVHYASDVLAGFLLSFIILKIFMKKCYNDKGGLK